LYFQSLLVFLKPQTRQLRLRVCQNTRLRENVSAENLQNTSPPYQGGARRDAEIATPGDRMKWPL